jgi:uncharacterized membrane protein YoaK (UPF0700 family)
LHHGRGAAAVRLRISASRLPAAVSTVPPDISPAAPPAPAAAPEPKAGTDGGKAAAPDGQAPLIPLLLVLTFITGLIDAVSYLLLGHVFVANMTGNVVLLGFSIAGVQDFSLPASLTALAVFAAGAAVGGRLGLKDQVHRGRFLLTALTIEGLCLAAAALPWLLGHNVEETAVRYTLIVLLGAAMGVQTAAVRRLAVPDLTTTVLTMTLAGIAADSTLAGGSNPRLGRRIAAIAVMLVGAGLGAFIALHGNPAYVLLLALALIAVGGAIAWRGHATD